MITELRWKSVTNSEFFTSKEEKGSNKDKKVRTLLSINSRFLLSQKIKSILLFLYSYITNSKDFR